MCGIWAVYKKNALLANSKIKTIMEELMALSEKRGKEASGVAATSCEFGVIKRSIPSSKLLKTRDFKKFEEAYIKQGKACFILGHSRMITNGAAALNNQPVVKHNMAMVHNGIIVNDEALWDKHSDLSREFDVDTEILLELFDYYQKKENSTSDALNLAYSEIYGMASTITIVGDKNEAIACSNNGSLYYYENEDILVIASEYLSIESLAKKHKDLFEGFDREDICQLNYGQSKVWKLPDYVEKKTAKVYDEEKRESLKSINANLYDFSDYEIDFDKIKKIRRCTKCVLPETMPYIEFDEDGVCNYCKTYKKQTYKSKEELDNKMEELRNASAPSMISFSGGRDSSYALHYFVKEQGLKAITYCYDWGMVTDLARRNQSRMCDKLGIEFVLVSADIKKKRENIRKNLTAWLNKPDLGMIPILMAGDKHYYYYANKVCKEYGIDTVLMSSNPFEKTYFKSGFAKVKPSILSTGEEHKNVEQLPIGGVFALANYYARQYMGNTKYINTSIMDTASAALSYYLIPHNYFRLYDYIQWDEETVDKTLLDEYDWEISRDTQTTWRIGDGTAPFYNYVYTSVAGFSENDTLRSNQIREGMITRDRALELVYRDNQPRWESMEWYMDTVGVDMNDALSIIKNMRKLY